MIDDLTDHDKERIEFFGVSEKEYRDTKAYCESKIGTPFWIPLDDKLMILNTTKKIKEEMKEKEKKMIDPEDLTITTSMLDVVQDKLARQRIVITHNPTGKEVSGIFDYLNPGDGRATFMKGLMKELEDKIGVE